jgi:hypothetical protein
MSSRIAVSGYVEILEEYYSFAIFDVDGSFVLSVSTPDGVVSNDMSLEMVHAFMEHVFNKQHMRWALIPSHPEISGPWMKRMPGLRSPGFRSTNRNRNRNRNRTRTQRQNRNSNYNRYYDEARFLFERAKQKRANASSQTRSRGVPQNLPPTLLIV